MNLSPSQISTAILHLERGDWQSAHEIVQKDEDSALACWAHGIVHIMEGDLPNARYWYRAARRQFPARPSAASEISELKAALTAQ
jgi:hypothetical protein